MWKFRKSYLQGKAGYRTNRYRLDPAVLRVIEQRFGGIMERYGYRHSNP